MNTLPHTPAPRSETPVPWDPIRVRDLVRETQAEGRHPAVIELGRREADSFRAFLAAAYGDEEAVILRDTYYLGLEVKPVEAPSRLAVTGFKAHDAWSGELTPPWTDRPGRAA